MKSNHLFIFPFRFDKIVEDVDSFDELCSTTELYRRVDLSHPKSVLKSLKDSHWVYEEYNPGEGTEAYNMYASFYDHIRPIIFNSNILTNQLSHLYLHKAFLDNKGKLEFKINGVVYTLRIEKVYLRIFEAGVGLLSINVVNDSLDEQYLVTDINDQLRKVHPVLLEQDEDGIREKDFFDYLKIYSSKELLFEFTNNFKTVPHDTDIYDYIMYLMGERIFTTEIDEEDKFFIKPVTGSEMFVLCHYVDDALYEKLKDEKDFFNKKSWQRLFLMGDEFGKINSFDTSFVQAEFYSWVNNDTLFGVTKNGFMMITKSDNEAMKMKFRTLFFKIIVLMSSVRASINRFTEDVTSISSAVDPRKEEDENLATLESIETLYKYYVKFINRLHFRDITADRDGENLHKIAARANNVEKKLEFINLEIRNLYNLYNYSRTITEKQKQEFGDKLALMGGLFLPAGVLSGIFGMNIFDTSDLSWQSVVISSVICYVLVVLFLLKPILRTYRRMVSDDKKDKLL